MRLTMKERRAVTKALCEQYRRAGKKERGLLLDRFVEATGFNRNYAARLLRNHGRRVEVAPGRLLEGSVRVRQRKARKRVYDEEVLLALRQLWLTLDCISGKRLKAALPALIERLVACKELRVKKAVRVKLLQVSAATIDRLLKPEREKHTLKGRSGTKPGTLLKHQIPVRTFYDWDDMRPGFVEIDLVGHDGGDVRGDYCQTLNVTDVATGWSEQAAVQNKAQMHVFCALQDLRHRLPFSLLGIDSDNGGEFINAQLYRYCVEHQINFTRSRPYRKNDNCYVEQKNWSIVRRFAGYGRFNSLEACMLLNDLYLVLRDYNNFFFPSMKLTHKEREGARMRKTYDAPKTPYERVLESDQVPQEVKEQLRAYYQTLNPAALRRRVVALQKKLTALAARPAPQQQKTKDEFIALVPKRRGEEERDGHAIPTLRFGP